MFAYCLNNPIRFADDSGTRCVEDRPDGRWVMVTSSGNVVSGGGRSPAKASSGNAIFGAGKTAVYQSKQEVESVPAGINLIFTVKNGTKESKTISSTGDSSKPISVYTKVRSDNLILSSAGLKVNIKNFTLNISLGLDNIGISGSIKNGDITNSLGLTGDLSQLKGGLEWSTTVKWDASTDVTEYNNVSFTGWGIAAAYCLATTGQWYSSPQAVY